MAGPSLRTWRLGALAGLLLGTIGATPIAAGVERFHVIPAPDYRVYDAVLRWKFLTSQTTLVLIQSATVIRFLPEQEGPAGLTWFTGQGFLGGRLDQGLVSDFLLKNTTPAKLEKRFDFGVRYRFISPDGQEEPEVSLAPVPARLRSPRRAQTAPPTIGVVAFSRVGYTTRGDQALVYVEENRADQTGAGFLILLRRDRADWRPMDTDVLWTARPDME